MIAVIAFAAGVLFGALGVAVVAVLAYEHALSALEGLLELTPPAAAELADRRTAIVAELCRRRFEDHAASHRRPTAGEAGHEEA